MNEKENNLPFKIGDRVTITERPDTWSSSIGGKYGLNDVFYPYTFTVVNIEKNIEFDYISIFDGIYGWTYYSDIFKKVEESEPQFEVGKWYKSNYDSTEWYYIKFSSQQGDTIKGECIRPESSPLKYEKDDYWNAENSIKQALEIGALTDLSEIQQYLPNGHPDKIANKPIEKWSVGSYVVFSKIGDHNQPIGTIDKITSRNIDHVILEKYLCCMLNRADKGEITWFPTLEEAEKFSKELLNKDKSLTINDLGIIPVTSPVPYYVGSSGNLTLSVETDEEPKMVIPRPETKVNKFLSIEE